MNYKTVFLALLVLFIFSCVTTGDNVKSKNPSKVNVETIDLKKLPVMTFNKENEGNTIYSFNTGNVISVEPDPLGGSKIIMEIKQLYFYNKKINELTYQLIFGSLKDVSIKKGQVKENSPLGKQTNATYIIARYTDLNLFLVNSSNSMPVKYSKYWWFSPDWLNSKATQWLTFREVESLKSAVEDFYKRYDVERSDNERLEDKSISTIHFFPEFDRINVKAVLNEYPEPIEITESILMTEKFMYNQTGLNEFQNIISIPLNFKNFKIKLLWQKGFDKFLQEEYKLNTNIWIYGNIMTVDNENKYILICVRDFSLKSQVEIYEQRLKAITGKE